MQKKGKLFRNFILFILLIIVTFSVLLICLVIGILLNLTALVLLLVAIISKRLSRWLINFAVKVLKFFGIRNIEGKK